MCVFLHDIVSGLLANSTHALVTRYDSVANIMAINRFDEIVYVFHANDNELLRQKESHRMTGSTK